MKRSAIAIVAVFLILAGGFAWLLTGYLKEVRSEPPIGAYRFRLTLAVSVNGEARSASSVIQIGTRSQPRIFPDAPTVLSRVSGDAVFLDLGSGRNLMALLTMGPKGFEGEGFIRLAPKVFDFPPYGGAPHWIPMGSKKTIANSDIPMLVTFDDIRNPLSVRVVEPENFGQVFGDGVKLESVTIELTNDPITRGIEEKLPWLEQLAKKGEALDGSRVTRSNEPANNLGALSFRSR
jgi:hypothetical protein